MRKSEQLNISTTRFSDELYDYLDSLSSSRKLSDQVKQWGEEHLRKIKDGEPPRNQCACNEMKEELKEIKSMLFQLLSKQHTYILEETHSDLVESLEEPMKLVSNDKVSQLLNADDVNYNF